MKAVILDMYGVIMKDTGDGFYDFINRSFPDLTPYDIYQIWDKTNIGEIPSLEVFRDIGYKGDLAKIEREYLDTIEIDEAFYDFADEIKKSYGLALISNDSSEWSKYLREKYKINKYFDIITVSGDVKMKKPDERIFNLTLKKLGLTASDCIYIDDRVHNLDMAGSLGMDTVIFNSRNVEYNGKTVKSFQELAELIANNRA